jgi:hypothetical protein
MVRKIVEDLSNDAKMNNIDNLILTIRESDIVGQALSQSLSREYKETLKKFLETKKAPKGLEVAPALSPVDIIILALLYKREMENKKSFPKKFEEMISREYPELEYACYYSIYRLEMLGLIEKYNNPGYKLSETAREIVKKAIKIKDEVVESIKNDSFLGWIYSQEKTYWQRKKATRQGAM